MTTQRHLARQSAWQSADSGQLLLVIAAGVLLVAAVAQTAAAGLVQPRDALAFGALIALGELLRLSLPGDREAAPIGSAGALGYALAVRVGVLPAMQPALQVVAVTAVAMIVGALPHLAAGRPAGVGGMASRLLAVAFVAAAFRPLAHLSLIDHQVWVRLAVMTVLIVAGWLAECVIKALIRADALRARFMVSLGDELRIQVPLGAAVGASAMLIALATEAMGLVALALLIAPLLVTQTAFRRYAGIRSTYLQTVRALARVTEVGGYVENGHSNRVGRLAVAVGRELGMSEPDLLELEYAALMHDIGQLSLADPIPGGATVLASPQDQERIAGLGASVIEQAGALLDGVAEIVRRQSQPWRGSSPEPPIGSRIIRAANAFDDLVGGSSDRDRSAAALERLRLDTAAEYDPRVVEALSKVAGRWYPGRL
ncbi:MAG TPA: HD domain-containing phosphohydrolase [Streptosporangiaceae bacterium]